MFGISYGELFLIIGATAALTGMKDLPIIARTAGRLAGKAVGYVQLARGQFDTVMQQSQASKVHKELQDTMAQLEAIRYEIRSISIINPGPLTRRLDGQEFGVNNGAVDPTKSEEEHKPAATFVKDFRNTTSVSATLQSQAIAYAKLAEAPTVKSASSDEEKLVGHGLLAVLPVSAESAGLLRKDTREVKGSDVMLEAILEAEVATNAKQFFSKPENQIPKE